MDDPIRSVSLETIQGYQCCVYIKYDALPFSQDCLSCGLVGRHLVPLCYFMLFVKSIIILLGGVE